MTAEREILAGYADSLRAEGYDVFIAPPADALPSFMKSFRPDAIALGPGKNKAIQVKTRTAEWKRRLRELNAIFEGQDDWEFIVLWSGDANQPAPVPITPAADILKRSEELALLVESDHLRPAVLLSWGIIEATARLLHPQIFRRAQSPGRIVEMLASEGDITPDEADVMRRSIRVRNGLIHGDLNIEVSAAELLSLIGALKSLLARVLDAEH